MATRQFSSTSPERSGTSVRPAASAEAKKSFIPEILELITQNKEAKEILDSSGILLVAAYQTVVVEANGRRYYFAVDTDEMFAHQSYAKQPPARGRRWESGVHFADGTHALQKYINANQSRRLVPPEVVEHLEAIKRMRVSKNR